MQYVVLRHEAIAEPHYDLMFETFPGSQLATWRSQHWPIESRVELARLRDHRRAYLDFQGEIAGQQGRVYQIARGECEVEVGENAVWTIRILSGAPPHHLTVRQIDAAQWEGEPK